jgi:cell division septation protein DedD
MNALRICVVSTACLLVVACSNPETDWAKAQAENTQAAYEDFLERHPDSEWSRRAQAEIDVIGDRRAWEKAQTADAVEAYNSYLLTQPVGAYIGAARQRIYELETEAAWAAAQAAGSRIALEDFIIRYADTAQAEQARARLTELASPPPAFPPAATTVTRTPRTETPRTEKTRLARIAPAAGNATKAAPKSPVGTEGPAGTGGNYRIQFGAFSTAATAQSEKARLEKKFGSTLGTLAVKTATTGSDLHRVQSTAMTEAAARSGCQKFKSSGQDCMIVRR